MATAVRGLVLALACFGAVDAARADGTDSVRIYVCFPTGAALGGAELPVGAARDRRFQGCMDVVSVDYSVKAADPAGGAGLDARLGPLVVEKRIDAASGALLRTAAVGGAYQTIEIYFVKSGSGRGAAEVFGLEFGNVAIRTIRGNHVSGKMPTEKITFDFASMLIRTNGTETCFDVRAAEGC